MDRLDSAQNTPQDAEEMHEEILADNDPATDDGSAGDSDPFNAQSPVPEDRTQR